MAREHTLTSGDPRADGTLRIDHMSSRNVLVRQDRTIDDGSGASASGSTDLPATGAAALVIVHKKSGKVKSTPVVLDRDGDGGSRSRSAPSRPSG